MSSTWEGKDPRQMNPAELKSWRAALGAAVRAVGRFTGRHDVVRVVLHTTYAESAYRARMPVRRGQYCWVPASPAGTIPEGYYPCIAIGDPANGYAGPLRWCRPVTRNGRDTPYMSSIDPDGWQRD